LAFSAEKSGCAVLSGPIHLIKEQMGRNYDQNYAQVPKSWRRLPVMLLHDAAAAVSEGGA
jgi:hypothetical protein